MTNGPERPTAKSEFLKPFEDTYHRAPAPQAIFGYEAMSAVLSVLKKAGASANDRATVVQDFFAIKNRDSVLGTYSINANGDTSLAPFVFSRPVNGKLVPFKSVASAGVRLGRGEQGTVKRGGLALMLLAAVSVLAGCGAITTVPNRISGKTLTIYSSVPLHGASAVSGQAVLGGGEDRARPGPRTDRQVPDRAAVDGRLDRQARDRGIRGRRPSTPTRRWRTAPRSATSASINSGASAISIPLLNRTGIPQISPTSTAVGLTSDGIGAAPGEPEKYYPTGIRTYARVVPSDAIEARRAGAASAGSRAATRPSSSMTASSTATTPRRASRWRPGRRACAWQASRASTPG